MKAIRLAGALLAGSLGVSMATTIGYVSNGSTLYQIDTTNGGVLGTPQSLSVFGLFAMTFSPGGTLYGVFTSSGGGQVGTIDPATGMVTLLPQTLPSIGYALAFYNSTLYLLDNAGNIQSVDLSTGLGGPYVVRALCWAKGWPSAVTGMRGWGIKANLTMSH